MTCEERLRGLSLFSLEKRFWGHSNSSLISSINKEINKKMET